MGTNKRLTWLDTLRGLDICLVVIAHATNIPEDIELLIYSFHMPLFYMISGFTFRYEKFDSLRACVMYQAKTLLLPYIVLYIIGLPFWYLNNVVLGSAELNLPRLLFGIVLGDSYLCIMSNGALWFLPSLFLTIVGFWLICDFDRRGYGKRAGMMALCLILAVCINRFVRVTLPWHLQCLPATLVFFYMGYLFRLALTSRFAQRHALGSDTLAVISAIAFLVGSTAAFANGKVSVNVNDYNNMVLALTAIVGISLSLALMFMMLPNIPVLSFIGRHSLTMYGLHIPLMRFLERWGVTAAFAAEHAVWLGCMVVVLLLPVTWFIDRYCPFVVGRTRRAR